ncbi:MAG: thioredoxin domain-containing protein [Phycisphaerales bacterium]
MPDTTHTNRPAAETSPYLLQHAHNPVDWYPWCDEAFAHAVKRGVPVFLSIGYSTCYWCHVMERESFENADIAAVMNERFVCIKVDREQRPDIDEIYMAATTTFTGSGGWPMSVFLDPATRKPFYAGTYFPPEPAHGRPSFPDLLRGLSEAWKDRRDEAVEQSRRLAQAVAEQVSGSEEPAPVGEAQLSAATTALLTRLDKANGGFGHAPKFPQPVFLDFLLEMRPVTDATTTSAIDMAVRKTLDAMAIGGIHDQIGGGFHRYAVDEHWTVPHFEKMLYDNAQLASVYTRAADVYDDAYYARTAQRTLDYCLAEMTDPDEQGRTGFYSAQDAEVDGREGLNYLWIEAEFEDALGGDPGLLELALDIYGLRQGSNFRDPHHPDDPKRSVLRLESRPDQLASRLKLTADELNTHIDTINARLMTARAARKQPGLDDKVIVSWNGMLIAALVGAGTRFDRDDYLAAAARATRFILDEMRSGDGQLLRTHRGGKASIPGLLEDYAALIAALLRLHLNI